ncbi:MAG TPA: hypothetical protein VFV70_16085 [Hyphomonadaceae bacterium]|nr:hypothetical protein [Hyphomonadaceae bacterium]
MRMKPMRVPAVLAALALAACGEASAPAAERSHAPEAVEPAPLDPNADAAEQAALASCGPVTAQGYCGVVFGMTPADARAKFPVGLEMYSGADPSDANRCFELFAIAPVQGVSFLVEMNKVGRLDVMSAGARTDDGFGVGTAAADIKAKYGDDVREQPNKYEEEISELVLSEGAAKFVFEIQDGAVRAWRAGVLPTIDYVEHCS